VRACVRVRKYTVHILCLYGDTVHLLWPQLYPTCGTGLAYFYNISYPTGTVFTVELRDTGEFGFLLPASEVRAGDGCCSLCRQQC
jgi:hypothetical protein